MFMAHILQTFFVRGKVHGTLVPVGLRYMKVDLVKELKVIAVTRRVTAFAKLNLKNG